MHVSLRICHLSDEDPNARLKQYLVRSSWHAVLRSNFACHMQHFPQKTSLAPVSRRCLFGSPRSCPPLFRHCNIEHVCQLAIPCETFNAHDRTVQFQQSGEGQHHWWARMSDLVRLWVHGPSWGPGRMCFAGAIPRWGLQTARRVRHAWSACRGLAESQHLQTVRPASNEDEDAMLPSDQLQQGFKAMPAIAWPQSWLVLWRNAPWTRLTLGRFFPWPTCSSRSRRRTWAVYARKLVVYCRALRIAGIKPGNAVGTIIPTCREVGNALIFCGERRHVAPAAILDLFSDGPPVKACFWCFETVRPCFEQARNIRGLHAMWRRFLPWHVPMFMTVTTGGTCLVIASLTICSGWTFSMPWSPPLLAWRGLCRESRCHGPCWGVSGDLGQLQVASFGRPAQQWWDSLQRQDNDLPCSLEGQVCWQPPLQETWSLYEQFPLRFHSSESRQRQGADYDSRFAAEPLPWGRDGICQWKPSVSTWWKT